MNNIKIISLKLKNFKGIKDLSIDFNGEDTKIFGDNATGKTSVYDAFTWLLFDKDSQGKTSFEVKALDEQGQHIHMLSHEVEAVLLVDGDKIKLRKVFEEKWTKKRGSATQEFCGHTSSYFVDDVPKNLKEYQGSSPADCREEIFKLLTSANFFNTQLPWQKRREILFDVCGDITDIDIIVGNDELKNLPEILQGRSLDDHKAIVKVRHKKINEELKKIPVRIDEVFAGLPDISNIVIDIEKQVICKATAQIQTLSAKVNHLEAGGIIAERKNRISEIEAEMLRLKTQSRSKIQSEINQLDGKRRKLVGLGRDAEEKIQALKKEIEYCNKVIKKNKSEMSELRAKWEKVVAEKSKIDIDEFCPTCRQTLPSERIDAARKKAADDFNLSRSSRLTEITAKGKELKEQCELSEKMSVEDIKISASLEIEQAGLQSQIVEVAEKLLELDQSSEIYLTGPVYKSLAEEKAQIEIRIGAAKDDAKEEIEKIKTEIIFVNASKSSAEKKILLLESAEKGKKRIEELKKQEKTLAEEFEKLTRELYLCEEFTRVKVGMLEENINSKFKLARFKLFSEQINGGLQECCETLYKGVPYSTGLNNGARINVGMDIINTLSEHYGLSLPVFIDNAESVTEILPTTGQMIKLVVSEQDKKLRVEKSGKFSA